MKFALWYNQKIDCWYLLDWSGVHHSKDIVITRFDLAHDVTKKGLQHCAEGGFRWSECGCVLFFDKYPGRSIATIKTARKDNLTVKPHLLRN